MSIPISDDTLGAGHHNRYTSPSREKITSPDCVASTLARSWRLLFTRFVASKKSNVAITHDPRATMNDCPICPVLGYPMKKMP